MWQRNERVHTDSNDKREETVETDSSNSETVVAKRREYTQSSDRRERRQ